MASLLCLSVLAYVPLTALSASSVTSPEPVAVVLTEMCYYDNLNVDLIASQLGNGSYTILSEEDTCGDSLGSVVRSIVVPTQTSASRRTVLASLAPENCGKAAVMASFYNQSLVTWNCPNEVFEKIPSKSGLGLMSLRSVARAFVRVVLSMRWKSVAVISSGSGWWPSLAQMMDMQLREIEVVPRHFFIMPDDKVAAEIEEKLQVLRKYPCRVVILCGPADEMGKTVLETIDRLGLARDYNTITTLVDVSTIPSWLITFNYSLHYNGSQVDNSSKVGGDTSMNESTKKHLLIFTEKIFENNTLETVLLAKLRRALDGEDDNRFVLLDLKDDWSWRPLLDVVPMNDSEFGVKQIWGNLDEWLAHHLHGNDCDGCEESEMAKLITVLIVLSCAGAFVAVVLGIAALARNQVIKKRLSEGPYKVLLSTADFVFPQLTTSRRVDEGIEAMLCCWLQQLQELSGGGPEVEKPDLLQGSGGSLRTPHRVNSSPNLAKQLLFDPRVRYNGDLVQMKPLPSGTIELKAKSVEVLVLLHGLRHENLNPLIGCLAEPPRAALVAEWCSRGSLQDVLQQDDIKLDWSFRLSLLTDLVRGMKYLHSTPLRVHGYLTSRNCVIDARWVLKITDYGLPTFFEAQGLPPAQKGARDLLWTAPELLRHSSLRKKGSQPGDVYSFGIICQEVVVRGEPFCMFALTPEEILEKVKRPPPLIRPSVSKGAAPPEAINIMRQCWAEQPELRPDFNAVHDQFKKLNHGRKVNIVDTMFQMLEKYSNNLEELIRERTEQLDIEKKKTEQLLNRMLPSSVADKLKLGMPVDPEEFEEVTIYFSDIVGFTTISAHSTPFQVVDLLNDLYTCFDATINAYNVYKVETIGDAYMVVGGLPVRIADHAGQVADMALELLYQSGKFRIRHLPATPLRLRIGLHTGPCCAGVVGLTMPRYCLFGDTVNTASRMESTGAAWRIHLSEATKDRLERAGGYQIESRGSTEVKGKGPMNTYWLLGKVGFDKVLPTPPSLDLDESLIVEPAPASPESQPVPEEPPSDNSSKQPPSPLPPPVHPDPTFIKTMETSKFATLLKNSESFNQRSDLHMVKSTSSDTPMSLGTPVSANEVTAALLAASNTSLAGFRSRHRSRVVDDGDISTPYSHYKCLSPKERTGKLLKRQFSLDRTEETCTDTSYIVPKLHKQNSLGNADLERIEEAPIMASSTSTVAPYHCVLSVSADSLIH